MSKTIWVFFYLLIAVMLASCDNECESEPNLEVDQSQLAEDIEKIDSYLAQNEIEAESHPSGIRYVIKRAGDGDKPGQCSQIRVSYEGKLISNGSVFDDGTEIIRVFDLQSLITGWQIGLPLIKGGGRITLFIPSVYGYGKNGNSNGGIPANANLQFEIILYEAF